MSNLSMFGDQEKSFPIDRQKKHPSTLIARALLNPSSRRFPACRDLWKREEIASKDLFLRR